MRGITKRFPGTVANDQIDLSVHPGEIHALLGENGAGKSTLMNILYGLHQPDAGEILLGGKPVRIDGPSQAISLGIGMVHQHFMLIPPFTVAENIVLGKETGTPWRLDMERAVKEVAAISERYGLRVDPRARVESLSVGTQQRVEILKALYRGAALLILDEPTAVLTPQEVRELGVILRQLVAQGQTIIFITHKLKEVLRIADRVTVIRRGRNVGTLETSGTTESELAALTVGRDVSLRVEKNAAAPGAPALAVENLAVRNHRGLPAVKGASFTLRTHEIVGIAGVDGNGQTELVEALTGLRPIESGRIVLGKTDLTNLSPAATAAAGLGHIPEDRQRRGLVLDFTVAENAVLGSHRHHAQMGWMDTRAIRSLAQRLIETFDVRPPNPDLPARSLSGGNRQKVILGREIDRQPRVLVAAQPTRGLDVGAIEFIHRRLVAERDAGKAVLLVSLELDEILALSDRILVIYEGEIVAEVPAAEATEEGLGFLMAGGGQRASV